MRESGFFRKKESLDPRDPVGDDRVDQFCNSEKLKFLPQTILKNSNGIFCRIFPRHVFFHKFPARHT